MNDDYVTSTIAVYDKTADEYAKQAEKRGPKIERSQFMQSIPEHGSILDVGCGSGRDAKIFCDHGFTVTGVDLSGKLLEIAKKNIPTAIFLKEDLRDLHFPSNSFDGIWACTSLIHIKHVEIERVLRTFYTFLKPNGIIGIVMKAGSGERFTSSRSLPSEKRYFSFYSKSFLKSIIANVGFRITEMHTYNEKDCYEEVLKNKWKIVIFATK
jgi:ubiquinone/menaquinone biosynthesis C-methylase UbiE